MIIIYRGFGFLTPLLWLASLLITEHFVGQATYEAHGWPKFLAGLLGAILIGWIGSSLNKNRTSGNTHAFFFLDMEVWAVISFIGGIVMAIKG